RAAPLALRRSPCVDVGALAALAAARACDAFPGHAGRVSRAAPLALRRSPCVDVGALAALAAARAAGAFPGHAGRVSRRVRVERLTSSTDGSRARTAVPGPHLRRAPVR